MPAKLRQLARDPCFQFVNEGLQDLMELLLHPDHVFPHSQDDLDTGQVDLQIVHKGADDPDPFHLIRRKDLLLDGFLLNWVDEILGLQFSEEFLVALENFDDLFSVVIRARHIHPLKAESLDVYHRRKIDPRSLPR